MDSAMLSLWTLIPISIKTEFGQQEVRGYYHTSNLALAVTPAVSPRDAGRFAITHVVNGTALWPETWEFEAAKSLCVELLALPGWENPDISTRLRHAAEVIARRYLTPSGGVA